MNTKIAFGEVLGGQQPAYLVSTDANGQISCEPGFGAYQGLAQKIKVPFSRIFPSFCSSEGSRAISKPEPNPGTHQTPVEMLSEMVSGRARAPCRCSRVSLPGQDL